MWEYFALDIKGFVDYMRDIMKPYSVLHGIKVTQCYEVAMRGCTYLWNQKTRFLDMQVWFVCWPHSMVHRIWCRLSASIDTHKKNVLLKLLVMNKGQHLTSFNFKSHKVFVPLAWNICHNFVYVDVLYWKLVIKFLDNFCNFDNVVNTW